MSEAFILIWKNPLFEGFRKFYSVADLVAYFKRCPIYTSPQGYKLSLGKAAKRPGA